MLLKIESYLNRPKRSLLRSFIYCRILNTDLYVVIYLRNFLLFKTSFIIGQFLLFFASEEEKNSYKNFSDGFERFILGNIRFDKIAPNKYNSTKIDKKIAIHTQSTQACDPLNIKLQSC